MSRTDETIETKNILKFVWTWNTGAWYTEFLFGLVKVLKLDSSNSCIYNPVKVVELLVHFKWMSCVVYNFFFKKS